MKNFTFFYHLDRLLGFLETYSLFYTLLTNTVLLHRNKDIEKEINIGTHHKKSISQIYYENYLLATDILELEKVLVDLYNRKRVNFQAVLKQFIKIAQPDVRLFFDFAITSLFPVFFFSIF